jgi:peroxiredoxin
MLADGNAEFTRSWPGDGRLEVRDGGAEALLEIVVDGVVKELNVEAPGEFNVSSAEATACQL